MKASRRRPSEPERLQAMVDEERARLRADRRIERRRDQAEQAYNARVAARRPSRVRPFEGDTPSGFTPHRLGRHRLTAVERERLGAWIASYGITWVARWARLSVATVERARRGFGSKATTVLALRTLGGKERLTEWKDPKGPRP